MLSPSPSLVVLINLLAKNVRTNSGLGRTQLMLLSHTDIDTISIDSTLVIPEQSIGVGTITKGLEDDIDGILGLGPAILTQSKMKIIYQFVL